MITNLQFIKAALFKRIVASRIGTRLATKITSSASNKSSNRPSPLAKAPETNLDIGIDNDAYRNLNPLYYRPPAAGEAVGIVDAAAAAGAVAAASADAQAATAAAAAADDLSAADVTNAIDAVSIDDGSDVFVTARNVAHDAHAKAVADSVLIGKTMTTKITAYDSQPSRTPELAKPLQKKVNFGIDADAYRNLKPIYYKSPSANAVADAVAKADAVAAADDAAAASDPIDVDIVAIDETAIAIAEAKVAIADDAVAVADAKVAVADAKVAVADAKVAVADAKVAVADAKVAVADDAVAVADAKVAVADARMGGDAYYKAVAYATPEEDAIEIDIAVDEEAAAVADPELDVKVAPDTVAMEDSVADAQIDSYSTATTEINPKEALEIVDSAANDEVDATTATDRNVDRNATVNFVADDDAVAASDEAVTDAAASIDVESLYKTGAEELPPVANTVATDESAQAADAKHAVVDAKVAVADAKVVAADEAVAVADAKVNNDFRYRFVHDDLPDDVADTIDIADSVAVDNNVIADVKIAAAKFSDAKVAVADAKLAVADARAAVADAKVDVDAASDTASEAVYNKDDEMILPPTDESNEVKKKDKAVKLTENPINVPEY